MSDYRKRQQAKLMANRRVTLPRLLTSAVILGVGLFLAGCSPTFAPAATGSIDAATQTADLVAWLTEAGIGEQATAAVESDKSAALQFTRATASTAVTPSVQPSVRADAYLPDASCDDTHSSLFLATHVAPSTPVAGNDDARHEIDDLIDFLYGLPRGNGEGSRPIPYDGDL